MFNAIVSRSEQDEQWAPVSDLMATLMLIFMFIAIIFIQTLVQQKEVSNQKCDEIYHELKAIFGKKFKEWDAELLKDLTVQFYNPEILFSAGEADITERFKGILDGFFPHYIESIVLYEDDIQEIRIEGHTSSEYKDAKTEDDAYIKNMELSQDRAREILQYVLAIPEMASRKKWAKSKITANGLSSSKLRYTYAPDGSQKEDAEASRRVVFRILASSCQKAGRYPEQGESNV